MRELVWQLNRKKPAILLLAVTFAVILFPICTMIGEDTILEAVCRIIFLSLGVTALMLYEERIMLLREKGAGYAFYRSMPRTVEKEKRRWWVSDLFLVIVATVWFLLYEVIRLAGNVNGSAGFLYALFFGYLLGTHLLYRHPYLMLCVTFLCMFLLGFRPWISVHWAWMLLPVGVFVLGEVWFYRNIGKLWVKER